MTKSKNILIFETDVLVVGSGIMGATLASILKEIEPTLRVDIVEALNTPALESSHAYNNAGTGHAGYCELNYTPLLPNNKIDIQKAIQINAGFEMSLQYWSYLTKKYRLFLPDKFIKRVPHISLVNGDKNIAYLKKRYFALKNNPLFKTIEFSSNFKTIEKWIPLLKSKKSVKKYAATKVESGTDVDFGEITFQLISILKTKKNFYLRTEHKVLDLNEDEDGSWLAKLNDDKEIKSKFVFIASGGNSLKLLQKTKVFEQIGYAGFPISGQWLVCKDPLVVAMHSAKVYGKADIGSPPMSMPHLDLRIINGEKILMFGPFASLTSKFLISGSFFDLISSVKFHNLKTLCIVFLKEWPLLIYLIKQNLKTHKNRMSDLRQFYPDAKSNDWHLEDAGIRVQIMKKTKKDGPKLEFGTEIIYSKQNNLAALLGASPGASISVQSMIHVVEKCLIKKERLSRWKSKIKKMIPSYDLDLEKNPKLLKKIRSTNQKILGINY
jgi:malate dehydrogenase (quinone)